MSAPNWLAVAGDICRPTPPDDTTPLDLRTLQRELARAFAGHPDFRLVHGAPPLEQGRRDDD